MAKTGQKAPRIRSGAKKHTGGASGVGYPRESGGKNQRLSRRIFSAHVVGWICVGIVACGFVLQRIGAHNVPPSNHRGNNVYLREGGYYYDEFVSPIALYVIKGRLPEKFDAWQAYHPPLFTLLGGGFVRALEKSTSMDRREAFLQLLWVPGLIYVLFGAASYWFFRQALGGRAGGIHSVLFVLVFAILVFNPSVFIQSLDLGNDLLVNMLILLTISSCIWYWHTCRWDKFNARSIAIGAFLGLAAFTKHTGVGFAPVVVAFLGFVVVAWGLPRIFRRDVAQKPNGESEKSGPRPSRFRPVALRCLEAGAALLLAFLMVQGEYSSNYRKYGKLMPSYCDEQVADFKTLAVAKQRARTWNYAFDPVLFVRYSYTPKYDKPLWEQPVYKNIPTSMPALFWDDLGFYSKEGASLYYYYPPKKTPPLVRVLPFLLALALAAPFAWATWKSFRHPELACAASFLCIVFFIVAWYLRLLATCDPVGVKAKYIVCVVPLFLGLSLRGLASVAEGNHARNRIFARAAGAYLVVLLGSCIVYDFFFAFT